ncbi:NEAT domain-containing protein [Paenibacillus sp. TRM 82003]|nr:NEAT domain-containing protein [Paenibacillus sp. TRM 82003]
MFMVFKKSFQRYLSILLAALLLFTAVPVAAAEAPPATKVKDGEYDVSISVLANGTNNLSVAHQYLESTTAKLFARNGQYRLRIEFNNYDWFEYWGSLKPGGTPAANAGAVSEYEAAQVIEVKDGYSVRGPEMQSKAVTGYYGTVEFPIQDVTAKQEMLMHIVIKDLYLIPGQPALEYDEWYRAQIVIDASSLPFVFVDDGSPGSGAPASRDELVSQITVTEAVYTSTNGQVGAWHGAYPIAARSSLYSAIEEARTVVADAGATEEQLSTTYRKLVTALDKFQRSQVTVDKTELSAAIREADALAATLTYVPVTGLYVAGAIVQYNPPYTTAIASARTVSDDVYATQEQVNASKDSLFAAKTKVEDNRIVANPVRLIVLDTLDAGAQISAKSSLFDPTGTILKRSTLREHANITINADASRFASLQYYRPSLDGTAAFQSSAVPFAATGIDSGAGKYSVQMQQRTTVGASQSISGIVKLQYATVDAPSEIETVYLSLNGTLLDDLNAKIQEAQTLHTRASSGDLSGQYSASSLAALQTAIDGARATGTQLSATRPNIESATAALTAAVETFEASVVPDPGTGNPGTGNPGTGNPGTGSPGTGNPGNGTTPQYPADGSYYIPFTVLKYGTSSTSIANNYMVTTALVSVSGGSKSVSFTVLNSAEITGLTIGGGGGSVTSRDTANNTRVVTFNLSDLSSVLNAWVKVDWPAVNYHHEYDIHFQFHESQASYAGVTAEVPGGESKGPPDGLENPAPTPTAPKPVTPPVAAPVTAPGVNKEEEGKNPISDPKETATGGAQSTKVEFADTSDHWAKSNIRRAVELGIVTGFTDGSFRPNHVVTRGEFAVMISRALGLEGDGDGDALHDFGNIPNWAQSHVARVVAAGLISGFDDGTFRSDGQLTRAQLAVIVARAAGLPLDTGASLSFADGNDVPAWAQKEVAAAVAAGLIGGKDGNRFDPNATATRAEALTLIVRMLEKLTNK